MLYGIALLMMTLCGATGAFFFKKGAEEISRLGEILQNVKVYIGGMCYVAGALINIVLLKYIDYSILYPMTALTYIWSLGFAHFFMKETITKSKIGGIALICTGIILLIQ